MRYPKFLKDKGRIGFIAPSFGCAGEPYRTCFDEALKVFRKAGYETVLGPNCYEDCGLGKSNTPEKCGEEINDFFANDRCDAIISCGGGETMCEDLDYVDFEKIKKTDPKWFMGCSDNTNLTFVLPTLCDTAAIYGPCAAKFGMKTWHPAVEDAFALLKGEKLSMKNYPFWEKYEKEIPEGEEPDPLEPYNATEPSCMKLYKDGKLFVQSAMADGKAERVLNEETNYHLPTVSDAEVAEAFSGRLIGGCLDCLQTLCGTQYDAARDFSERYKEDGIIWFLESCDLSPMGIRRVLWQLDNAGWFNHVKGFIIGRALHFDEDFCGMNRINAVTGVLEKYSVPIILDADFGHLPPMIPVISGAYADVGYENGSLGINMILTH